MIASQRNEPNVPNLQTSVPAVYAATALTSVAAEFSRPHGGGGPGAGIVGSPG